MKVIVSLRDHLNIFQTIIGLIAVLMIDGHIWGYTDKGFRHKAMHILHCFLAILAKKDMHVPVKWAENWLTKAGLLALPSLNSSDSSSVANLIKREAFDHLPGFHNYKFNMEFLSGAY